MEAGAVPREAASVGPGLIAPRLLRAATDLRLVALVRQGHAAAFEAIYDRHSRPITSFCRHMLGHPEDAADAVQHTFTSAYTAITRSDNVLQLRPWLFTIARNRCLSVLRARREHPAGELVEPATEGLAAQVQRREDLRQLLVDMHELPEQQRAALVLAELGALSHNEIGTAIGVPPAKVKALVFQARESLIASRGARDTDCQEIRREIATARGAALRRASLRRHLRQCQGCREYRSAVQRQRRSLAAILPVAPIAGLKETILGGTSGGAAAGGGVATGGSLLASSAFKGLVVKGLLGAGIGLVAAGGTVALVRVLASTSPPNALADTGAPVAGSVHHGLHSDGVRVPPPVGAIRWSRTHAPASAAAQRTAGDQAQAAIVAVGSPRSVAPPHAAAVIHGHGTGQAPAPAATPRLRRHSTTSSSSGPEQSGSQRGASRSTSHGHGHAYGHDPGHDPGLHLGWGQGDGGGRTHPHGGNPRG